MNANKNIAVKSNIQIFGSTKVMVISALLVAMSIVLGKFLKISIGDSIRISFENLPVLMSGIFFGPVVGAAVAACADLIGCLLYGYAINPIITLGAVSIGAISGLIFQAFKKDSNLIKKLCFSIFPAHIVGSMIIKSIGLFKFYGTPMETLLLRIPIYICTAIAETAVIFLLMNNKAFKAEIEKTWQV